MQEKRHDGIVQRLHVKLRFFVDQNCDLLRGALGQHSVSFPAIGGMSKECPSTHLNNRALRCLSGTAWPSSGRRSARTGKSRTRNWRTWCILPETPPLETGASWDAD